MVQKSILEVFLEKRPDLSDTEGRNRQSKDPKYDLKFILEAFIVLYFCKKIGIKFQTPFGE